MTDQLEPRPSVLRAFFKAKERQKRRSGARFSWEDPPSERLRSASESSDADSANDSLSGLAQGSSDTRPRGGSASRWVKGEAQSLSADRAHVLLGNFAGSA